MIERRALLRLAAVAAGASWCPATAAMAAEEAQDYPSRPIRLLMPYTPGGAPDLLARSLGAELGHAWDEPLIVENRPGGNGIVACETVARARPDGYTLVMGSLATHAINASAYRKLPYNPVTNFAAVTQVGSTPLIITGNPNVPAKSLGELIAYAKANPGKLTFASVGQGSLGHLAGMLFQMETGTSMVHVPYKGISQGSTDLLSGTVDLAFSNVLNVLPFIKSGQLTAYGVTSKDVLPILPDVPTVASVLPGYKVTLWWGLFAPAGTPAPIVDKLSEATVRTLNTPANVAKWAEQGVFLTGDTPEQFEAIVKADIEKWSKVVTAAGVSL